MDGGAVESEARITLQILSFAGSGHRTEAEIAIVELALDARDSRRAVGPQRRDRLVATGGEKTSHPLGENWLSLFDRTPRRHCRAA
jgi:hypothetical protein